MSLRDLSLAHNRIQRVEHLDSLQQLQVLSLSSNLVEELDNVSQTWRGMAWGWGVWEVPYNSYNCALLQVKYLRQFKHLQSLALKGNPLASSEDYEHFVIAYIPSLHYLDFRMILDAEVSWLQLPGCRDCLRRASSFRSVMLLARPFKRRWKN